MNPYKLVCIIGQSYASKTVQKSCVLHGTDGVKHCVATFVLICFVDVIFCQVLTMKIL
jgi:hypothetical protein